MVEMTKDQADALRMARDKLKAVADESNEREHLETGDALDAMQDAYNAIDWVFTPDRRKSDQPTTIRICICCDIDANGTTDAYRKLFKMMGDIQTENTLEWFDWESSDEWYYEDGERVSQDIIELARATVFDETQTKKFDVHVRLAEVIEARTEEEAFDVMMAAFENRDGFEFTGHDIIEQEGQS